MILFNLSLNFLFSSSNFLFLRISSSNLFARSLFSFFLEYLGIKSLKVLDWYYKIININNIHPINNIRK